MQTIEVFGAPVSEAARRGWKILLDRVVLLSAPGPVHISIWKV